MKNTTSALIKMIVKASIREVVTTMNKTKVSLEGKEVALHKNHTKMEVI